MLVPPVPSGGMNSWANEDPVQQLNQLNLELQQLWEGYPGNEDKIIDFMKNQVMPFLQNNKSAIEMICKNQGWTGKESQNFMHLLVGPDGQMDDGALFNDMNNFIEHPNTASMDEFTQDLNQLQWFMTNSPPS